MPRSIQSWCPFGVVIQMETPWPTSQSVTVRIPLLISFSIFNPTRDSAIIYRIRSVIRESNFRAGQQSVRHPTSTLLSQPSNCSICNRAFEAAAGKPATRRPCCVFRSAARQRSKGRSSYRNRLTSISRACPALLVAIKANRTLTGTPPKSTSFVPKTVVLQPSHTFLPVLPSGAHRPEADLPNPLRSLDSLPHPKKLSPAPVIVSQPHDFNIPDLTGTDCPDSSAGPES